MIWIDIPGPNARMQRRLVWYLLYSVTNPGKVFHPVEDKDGTYSVTTVDRPIRFIPVFTMEVHNRLHDEAAGFTKVYSEKCIPLAMAAVRGREDRNRKFLSTFEMPEKEIAVGEEVWGIATWEDIDPRVVWFSIYVEGLTNAYHWEDDPAKYAAIVKGTEKGSYRTMFSKMLKLNFWRPGDEFAVKENQVRLGVPARAASPVCRSASGSGGGRSKPALVPTLPRGNALSGRSASRVPNVLESDRARAGRAAEQPSRAFPRRPCCPWCPVGTKAG